MYALDHLLTLLARQRDVLQRLLELARDEQACLLNSRLDTLDTIVEAQANLLIEQGTLSIDIVHALEQLAVEHPFDERITLARVAEHLPMPAAAQVRSLYRDLTAMAETLRREGRINWALAQQGLRFIRFTLQAIGRTKDGPLPYLPHQRSGEGNALRLLMDASA